MHAEVREATPDDRLDVRRVLDAAMLDVREDLAHRIESGDVLVATEPGDVDAAESGSVLGALVLVPLACAPRERGAHANGIENAENAVAENEAESDGARVDAVAVRRARRARGIGTALVEAALAREGRLVAEFDPRVAPFYESLNFDVLELDGESDRLRGTRDAE
ncbi:MULTISPECIES: GNAT family N-acetyltransferase [Halorussus]|uniref:GNAT family N-acetyltransferase n=1 Tax=Halorussus TaxID=1070314 RepID=UPI0034A3726F